jgi:hypothetical protein
MSTDDTKVVDVVLPAYKTTDFEFAAVALTYNDPPVRLAKLETIQGNHGSNRSNYAFVLVSKDASVDIRTAMNNLSRAFVNRDLLIEPQSWLSIRRFLRSHMLNENRDKQNNKGPNRGKGR